MLGQLKPHHQLPDLSAGRCDIPLLQFDLRLEAPAAELQEHPLPTLQLVRGHLAFPRDRIERLAPKQAQDQPGLRWALPRSGSSRSAVAASTLAAGDFRCCAPMSGQGHD
jgi:hypothetical protein